MYVLISHCLQVDIPQANCRAQCWVLGFFHTASTLSLVLHGVYFGSIASSICNGECLISGLFQYDFKLQFITCLLGNSP